METTEERKRIARCWVDVENVTHWWSATNLLEPAGKNRLDTTRNHLCSGNPEIRRMLKPQKIKAWIFQDPRYRQERIWWVSISTLVLVLGAGTFFLMSNKENSPLPQERDLATSAPSPDKEILAVIPSEKEETQQRITQALDAFKAGDLTLAAEKLGSINLEKAQSSPAWELAGLLEETKNEKERAIGIYSRAISLSPSEGLYYRRGVIYRDSDQLDLALADFEKATVHIPSHVLLLNEKFLLMIQMGKIAEMAGQIAFLEKLQADPNGWIFARAALEFEKGNYQKGSALLASGRDAIAPKIFQQVLKNPVLAKYQSNPAVTAVFFPSLQQVKKTNAAGN